MNSSTGGGAGAGAGAGMSGMRSPFTVSQWQELEHQALIFKYMMAGMPVPPDLVLPIQKSFESISHRLFHHPTMAGYSSFYGKKVDPEPGRCRRTDGKKWRCSKDAYPDSKYCERHMHRGRNRSRKPVESQTMTQSSSTVTSLTVTGSSPATATAAATTFQNLPLNAFGNTHAAAAASGTTPSHYHLDSIPYGIPNKDYRYMQGLKGGEVGVGEHSFLGGNRSVHHMESALENAWAVMPKSNNEYGQHSHLHSHSHSFLNSEFGSSGQDQGQGQGVKQEVLRPFFDEWPKSRDSSWSGLEEERSNHTSAFSTTQLSISIPLNSSDFSPTSSRDN